MGRLIINNAITVNGAFEAPVPEPDGGSFSTPTASRPAREVAGSRRDGAWPQDLRRLGRGLATDGRPSRFEAYAKQMNSMPKYVASRTLSGPLEWNATLLEGNLAESVSSLKDEHHGNLVVSGAGELARELMAHGLVDEVWFTVSPYLWATGPRIFEDVGAVRLELVSTTTFRRVWYACATGPPQQTPPLQSAQRGPQAPERGPVDPNHRSHCGWTDQRGPARRLSDSGEYLFHAPGE